MVRFLLAHGTDSHAVRTNGDGALHWAASGAFTDGDPLVPPLVYQNDLNVREMGHEKLVGKDLLVGVVAGAGERSRDVYLPAGTWRDYHNNTRIVSTGQWVNDVPLWRNGTFTLPTYARRAPSCRRCMWTVRP